MEIVLAQMSQTKGQLKDCCTSQLGVYSDKVFTCRAFARGDCRRGGKCRYAHPKVPVVPPGVATVGVAPRMYDANDIDEIFAKKPKIA